MSDELGSNRLAILAAEVQAAHIGVLDAAKTAAERAIEAGRALLEAKELVKHGLWGRWLKEHCGGISERTAQLYMQIAGLGLEPEMIADMGLKAAAKAIVIRTPDYNPFFHCTPEDQRQWHLYVAYGVPWGAVEWLLNKQFVNPDEWVGPEGARWRRAWGLRQIDDLSKQSWAAFQQRHAATALDEAIAMAGEMERKRYDAEKAAPRRLRRRRKSATVTDLATVEEATAAFSSLSNAA